MRKSAAAVMLSVAVCVSLTACGGGNNADFPSSGAEQPSERAETAEASAGRELLETEMPATEASEEYMRAFPCSIDELSDKLQELGETVTILEPKETAKFSVQGIKVGIAYDAASTWLYCFSEPGS